ncbi:MAG: alpha/beta fold hydrolase [Longimicrobiales bacterium]|nr:alpha/beta fold hydrolase [Longimicrobiales bacterium]
MSASTHLAAAADAAPFLDAYETSGSSPGAPTLHLLGAGRVGRAFLRLLAPGDARLVAVTDRSGTAFDRRGLDACALADWKEGSAPLAAHPQGAPGSAIEALRRIRADVVVDATATDFRRPRWHDALDAAVTRGSALALASKDPAAALGHRWLTPGGPGRVGVNAALGGAGAGLRDDLAELRVGCAGVALAGSASTTTILSVVEQGGSFDDGVEVARARGLLEADPEQDFRGLDAAVKLAVVARVLWNLDVSVEGSGIEDLRGVDASVVRARARVGRTTRLVARAWRSGAYRVAYEELPKGSPLAVPTDRVAYAFELPGGAARFHLGAGLGPEATAAALLADVQALAGRRLAGARRSGRVDGELGTGVAHLPADFALESGTALHPAHVAFESRGPDDGPAVLVLGGLSAHRDAGDAGGRRGWWWEQVGPGRALDTLTHRVLSVDFLGGSGGSSGPTSSAHWPRGAAVSTTDQARAILALLDALGVERLRLAVGASYGGRVVRQLTRLAPHRVEGTFELGHDVR